MKSIGEILKLSTQFLKDRKVEPARRISEELLSHVLSIPRMHLYLDFERPVLEKELAEMRSFLKRASQNEPVQYILKEMDFYGCKIKVDPRALIPRPETEILVDLVSKKRKGKVLWDLCTGTGCIGISLKKKHPELSVSLVDISHEALCLAKENAALSQVDVTFFEGDFWAPLSGSKADIIVCNPPYVSEKEYQNLDSSVRDFEPKLALVGGEDGALFYRKIKEELKGFLNPGGQLFLEIGSKQKDLLKSLFSQGEVYPDWSGASRFFILENF